MDAVRALCEASVAHTLGYAALFSVYRDGTEGVVGCSNQALVNNQICLQWFCSCFFCVACKGGGSPLAGHTIGSRCSVNPTVVPENDLGQCGGLQ
jgi:hypothetical protein